MTTYGRGLRGFSLASLATISVAFVLVFFYAPLDSDQGFVQKIFYLHVPLAIVSLCGFVLGALLAIGHLPGSMRLTFFVSLAGIALLFATLCKYELAAKNVRMQTRALRRTLLGEDAMAPLRRSAAPS